MRKRWNVPYLQWDCREVSAGRRCSGCHGAVKGTEPPAASVVCGIDSTADSCGAQAIGAVEKLRCGGRQTTARSPAARTPRGRGRGARVLRRSYDHAGEQGFSRQAGATESRLEGTGRSCRASTRVSVAHSPRGTPFTPHTASRGEPSKRLRRTDSPTPSGAGCDPNVCCWPAARRRTSGLMALGHSTGGRRSASPPGTPPDPPTAGAHRPPDVALHPASVLGPPTDELAKAFQPCTSTD